MSSHQPGILEDPPPLARYLTFRLVPSADFRATLARLPDVIDGSDTVVGIGPATVAAVGGGIAGLHEPPCLSGAGQSTPATPAALWVWLRGTDRGELLHRGRVLASTVKGAFAVDAVIDAFLYAGGRDLTGYEDGTENPKGQAALEAAFVAGAGPGLDGSSFVAVQKWVHDLERFTGFDPSQQDAIIGRRRSNNEEIEDAPPSAHVKRAAQESFDPEAFVLRRSMPWTDGCAEGLVFVSFGRSLDAFEAQLRRMVGLEDGIVDGLFRFTRPVTTGYFWCPPVDEGRLDLSALHL